MRELGVLRSFGGVHIALFSAGGSISKKFAHIASDAGATVRCPASGAGRCQCSVERAVSAPHQSGQSTNSRLAVTNSFAWCVCVALDLRCLFRWWTTAQLSA